MPPPSGKWTNLAYLQNLVAAINSRIAAQTPFATPIPTPVAGDRADILIHAMQVGMELQVSPVPATTSFENGWVAPNFNPPSLKATAVAANQLGNSVFSPLSGITLYLDKTSVSSDPCLRHYCGLPDDAVIPLASDFRRIKPRAVSSLTNATDLDSNTAVAGQRAFYAGASLGGFATDLYIVKYNGSAWVQDYSGMPDHLDSTLAPPYYCRSGKAQPGDYILSHIFTELELIINAATTIFTSGIFPQLMAPFTFGGVSNFRNDTGASIGSWTSASTAEANAIANAVDSLGGSPTGGASTVITENSAGTDFGASTQRNYGSVTDMAYGSPVTGRFTSNRQTYYFVGQDVYSLVGFPPFHSFNNFGDACSATATVGYATGVNGAVEAYLSTGVPGTFGTPAPGHSVWEGYVPSWFGKLSRFTGLPTV